MALHGYDEELDDAIDGTLRLFVVGGKGFPAITAQQRCECGGVLCRGEMGDYLLMREEEAEFGGGGTLVEWGEVIVAKEGVSEGVEEEDGGGLIDEVEYGWGCFEPTCMEDAACFW